MLGGTLARRATTAAPRRPLGRSPRRRSKVHSHDGPAIDPLLGYLAPRLRSRRGRGLWLIRQLTDLVEIRTAASGAAVRMRVCTATSSRM